METFRYLPPAPEEQREFVLQLVGTLLGLGVIIVLWLRTPDFSLRGTLIGFALAIVWMLGRNMWRLEKKAQRSQHGSIGVDAAGLHLTDGTGRQQDIEWDKISGFDVVGGRIAIKWADGRLLVGARELENGMNLMRDIQKFRQGETPVPSNFISLEPK